MQHFVTNEHAEIVGDLPGCCLGACRIMSTLLARGRWFDTTAKARAATPSGVLRELSEAMDRVYRKASGTDKEMPGE